MIAWLDAVSAQTGQPTVPMCLEGWEPREGYALCHVDTAEGHLVGVADPLTVKRPLRWADSGVDGWKVGQTSAARGFHPAALERKGQDWYNVRPVGDLRGRIWLAPVILTDSGSRAFRVAYGPNWLPALTEEQARLEAIARAARDDMHGSGEIDATLCCQWAAELLCALYHLTPGCIASLGLLDDALVGGVLCAAVSESLTASRGTSGGPIE